MTEPKIISFTPSTTAPVSRENGTRERKPARLARAKQMFSKPASIKFLGRVILPIEAAKALEQGQEILIAGQPVKAGKPGILACVICQGTHGSAEKFHSRTDLVALTSLYENVASKTVFALSDSCREEYLAEFVSKSLTNPTDYLAHYPKAPTR